MGILKDSIIIGTCSTISAMLFETWLKQPLKEEMVQENEPEVLEEVIPDDAFTHHPNVIEFMERVRSHRKY